MASTEVFYVSKNSKKPRLLTKLKGHLIDSIGWNTDVSSVRQAGRQQKIKQVGGKIDKSRALTKQKSDKNLTKVGRNSDNNLTEVGHKSDKNLTKVGRK